MRKSIVAVMASVLLLSGCTSGAPLNYDGTVAPQTGSTKSDVKVFTVDVNGSPVTCIETIQTTAYGHGIGLACDF